MFVVRCLLCDVLVNVACCVLCLVFAVCWLLFVGVCCCVQVDDAVLLYVADWCLQWGVLFVVCWLLLVAARCGSLAVVPCSLLVVRCLLCVVCCCCFLLCVVRCL